MYTVKKSEQTLQGCKCAFTLLESLIALSIGAVILLVVGGLFYTTQTWEGAHRARMQKHNQVEQAIALIRDDLLGAFPPSDDATNCTIRLARDLTHTHERIRWSCCTTVYDANTQGGFAEGVEQVNYEVFLGGEKGALVRSSQPLVGPMSLSSTNTLLSGLTAFSISFYDGAAWVDEWTAVSNLPHAARIALSVEDDVVGEVAVQTEVFIPAAYRVAGQTNQAER